MISERFLRVKQTIADICQKIGRNPEEISIVGASKYTDADGILKAFDAGLCDVAENKVQDARKKFLALEQAQVKIRRHMIGHLQSNKVKEALKLFDVIQSVDSQKIAAAIEKEAQSQNRQIDILIEVNTSGEPQKYGVAPEEVAELINSMKSFKMVRVLGLMTMAPFVSDEDVIRSCFRSLRECKEQLEKEFATIPHVEMKVLSMGMSDDYPLALEEGSNMVRIGRAIFK